MFEGYIELIENKLLEILKHDENDYAVLKDAMIYSTSAGGKRVRPCVLLEFAKICGLDPKNAVNFACALEMIHTYSLIHDDLPCMDNDDMRRGEPACHISFGEANALLAGDALLTDAFKVALSTDIEQKDRVVKAGVVLAECAGSDGMIAGQVIDLKYEDTKAPLLSVIDMYRLKTGALLIAAAKIGCILGGATEKEIEAAESFATNLGLAFQIKDDILDITSSTEVLGKPVGSDSEQNKSTYVTYKGLQTAQDDVEKYTADAIKSLEVFEEKAKNLQQFAKGLINRNI